MVEREPSTTPSTTGRLQRAAKPRKLGKKQRALLLTIELWRREHGQAPMWKELAAELGNTKTAFAHHVQHLRTLGLVEYTEQPRSIRVTEAGLAAAVGGKVQRPEPAAAQPRRGAEAPPREA